MRRVKSTLLILPWLALACVEPSALDERVRNNGHLGQLSVVLPGLPAVGQPFVMQVFRRERDAACTGDAAACAVEVPLRHVTARCDSPLVCSVPAQELVAQDGRFWLTLRANHLGTTTIHVDAVAQDGETLRDSFCVRVVRPLEMEVDCPSCGEGSTGDHGVTCRLFNRGESSLPLQALCDATSPSGDVVVERSAPGWLPPSWDAADAPATVRGSSFVVRAMTSQPGRVWFHQGALRQLLATP
jgi:hypothetical protein